MMQEGTKNRIKEWLDRSPTVTLIVVAAAIIGFLLATINGGYTIWKEIREQRLSPTLVILGLTSVHQKKAVNTNSFLGIRTLAPFDLPLKDDAYDFDPKSIWEVPFYPVTLLVSNPCNHPLTILDIRLVVSFVGGSRHVSHTFVSALGGAKVSSFGPSIYLNPHEGKRFELDFLFIPVPEFMKDWELSNTEKEFEAFVVWHDDTGNEYRTPAMFFSKGQVYVGGGGKRQR
jgi:hypothetical protein